jgi:GR25 family glycosyltransferase involved in LPS biosynthesis
MSNLINKFDNIKHFSEIFDNIYVINLKESVDRKIHIIQEFERIGIKKYQIFEATHYDSDESKNIYNSNLVKKFPNCFRCNKKRCDCENNFLTPFQIGNWCSFLNVFADIIKNDYNFVLICEDDIVFTKQYERIINKLLSKSTI